MRQGSAWGLEGGVSSKGPGGNAKAAGKELLFSKLRKVGQQVDFSQFDSRSLSAIALNKDEKFTGEEINAAKAEMRSRSGQALLASFKSASSI